MRRFVLGVGLVGALASAGCWRDYQYGEHIPYELGSIKCEATVYSNVEGMDGFILESEEGDVVEAHRPRCCKLLGYNQEFVISFPEQTGPENELGNLVSGKEVAKKVYEDLKDILSRQPD